MALNSKEISATQKGHYLCTGIGIGTYHTTNKIEPAEIGTPHLTQSLLFINKISANLSNRPKKENPIDVGSNTSNLNTHQGRP